MAERAIALKALLKQRHLQGHTAFKKEYNKLAKQIDPELIDTHPSKAQFYRWLSGELLGLPYAHHCRVLEGMFPGWTAERLFQVHEGGIEFVPEPAAVADRRQSPQVPAPRAAAVGSTADVVAVFASRGEFMHDMPPHQLFEGAKRIRAVGLSLNVLVQNASDHVLAELLESGSTIQALFLDPDGENMKAREQEEGHRPGLLATLTGVNVESLQRLRQSVSEQAQSRLMIRTYDEPVRFNVTIIDNTTCVVQPYLPYARGVESPTLVARHQPGIPGLYETFTQVFDAMWDRAKEVV